MEGWEGVGEAGLASEVEEGGGGVEEEGSAGLGVSAGLGGSTGLGLGLGLLKIGLASFSKF